MTLSAAEIEKLRAEGLGATEIAKRLRIGRPTWSVSGKQFAATT
jgi:DNA-binding CsgD family transcriptional regulator